MAEITTWQCDGCDQTIRYRVGMATDWKVYRVLLEGAKGYPICHTDDEFRNTYHLCPTCAKRLFASADPRQWDRPAREKAA